LFLFFSLQGSDELSEKLTLLEIEHRCV
jgi:hypothetical protein